MKKWMLCIITCFLTLSVFAESDISFNPVINALRRYGIPHIDPGDNGYTPMIVNGSETGYKEFRGVVGLKMSVTQNGYTGQAICTATFIDPEVLLTAGHCVYLNDSDMSFDGVSSPSKVKIYNGANIMSWGIRELAKAKAIKKHETWKGRINTFGDVVDMAVIHLDRAIYDYDIYQIRDYPKEEVGDVGVIVGYGLTKSDGYDSGVHRKGEAEIRRLGYIMGKKNIMEIGGPSGTCQGDSGGPLFTWQDNQWVLSGITSFGGQVCYSDRGGYDVHVLPYRDWIEDAVREFTGHGLIGPGACGDSDDFCQPGDFGSCEDLGEYLPGDAPCNEYCSAFDRSVCEEIPPVCGDGEIESPEVCDGDSKSCASFGNYKAGSEAACKSDCTDYDMSTCEETICGDGKKEGKEFCDGGTTDCSTLGDYPEGISAPCKPDCSFFDTDYCTGEKTPECGNGILENDEECDDGNTIDGDGCDRNCMKEVVVVDEEDSTDDSQYGDQEVADTSHTEEFDENNKVESVDNSSSQNSVGNESYEEGKSLKRSADSGCSLLLF